MASAKVEIFWRDDNEWYPATIAETTPNSTVALVVYDDGEQEYLDLSAEVWRPKRCEGKQRSAKRTADKASQKSVKSSRPRLTQSPTSADDSASRVLASSPLSPADVPSITIQQAVVRGGNSSCKRAKHSSHKSSPSRHSLPPLTLEGRRRPKGSLSPNIVSPVTPEPVLHQAFGNTPALNLGTTVRPSTLLSHRIAAKWLLDENRRPSSPVPIHACAVWAEMCAEICLRYVRFTLDEIRGEDEQTVALALQLHDEVTLDSSNVISFYANWKLPLSLAEVHVESAIIHRVLERLAAMGAD